MLKGVCGKESHTAQAMDLLLFVVRGVSVVTDALRKAGCPVPGEADPRLRMPISMMKASCSGWTRGLPCATA